MVGMREVDTGEGRRGELCPATVSARPDLAPASAPAPRALLGMTVAAGAVGHALLPAHQLRLTRGARPCAPRRRPPSPPCSAPPSAGSAVHPRLRVPPRACALTHSAYPNPPSLPPSPLRRQLAKLILDRAVPFHGTAFNAAANDTANKLMGLNQVRCRARARRRGCVLLHTASLEGNGCRAVGALCR